METIVESTLAVVAMALVIIAIMILYIHYRNKSARKKIKPQVNMDSVGEGD